MTTMQATGAPTPRARFLARLRAIGIAVLESYFNGLEARYLPQARSYSDAAARADRG